MKFWTEGAHFAAQGFSIRRRLHPREGDEEIKLTPFWDTYRLQTGRLPPGRSCAAGQSKCLPVHENGSLFCPSIAIGCIVQLGASIEDDDYSPLGEGQHLDVSNPYDNGKHGKAETYAAIFDNAFRLPTKPRRNKSSYVRYPWTWPFGMGKPPARPFLKEFRRKDFYEAGFQPEVQAWVNTHRSFNIHGLSMEGWARWKSGTVSGLEWRNRGTMNRKNVNGDFSADACIVNMEYSIESGRKLMITDQGYVGWGHHKAQIGDHLYILKGCD